MPVPVQKLAAGRCYQTAEDQVRLIIRFEGDHVHYVVGRNGVFPVWNKLMWLRTRREAFAEEAEREVAHP